MDGYNLVHFGDISCFGFQITDVFFTAGNLDNLQENYNFNMVLVLISSVNTCIKAVINIIRSTILLKFRWRNSLRI